VANWDSCRIRDSQIIPLQTARPRKSRCAEPQK